jgi:hypothetical protein
MRRKRAGFVDINTKRRIGHNPLAHDLVTAYRQNTKSAARLDVLKIDSRLSRRLQFAKRDLQLRPPRMVEPL